VLVPSRRCQRARASLASSRWRAAAAKPTAARPRRCASWGGCHMTLGNISRCVHLHVQHALYLLHIHTASSPHSTHSIYCIYSPPLGSARAGGGCHMTLGNISRCVHLHVHPRIIYILHILPPPPIAHIPYTAYTRPPSALRELGGCRMTLGNISRCVHLHVFGCRNKITF